MFTKFNSELDHDGDEYVEVETGKGDDIVDTVAQELDSDGYFQDVNDTVGTDAEISPMEIDMSELTIDDADKDSDDTNDEDDTAEQSNTDEEKNTDEQEEVGHTDIFENDEEIDIEENSNIEETTQAEDVVEAEDTDVESQRQSKFNVYVDGVSLSNSENSETLLNDDDDDFDFTDIDTTGYTNGYADDEYTTDTTSVDYNDNPDDYFDSTDLSSQDDLQPSAGGEVEVSLSSGEWLQNDSDLSDTDLGDELQLQFDSLSDIDEDDLHFDFNFVDAGQDAGVFPELEDLESDEPINMLNDVDSDLLSDNESSDASSRF